VEPGQKLVELALRVKNPSIFSKDRSIGLEFHPPRQNSVKTEIRVPQDSEKAISEGAIFSVPPGGMWVRIIVDVPPGASPGCFKDITYSLKTREPGTDRGEIERLSLAKNVCVEETLLVQFVDHRYDPETNRVISHILVRNSANVGQLAILKIANCAFEIAEKEAIGTLKNADEGSERLSLDKSIAIPHDTNTILTVYFTPKAGKKPSLAWYNCTAKLLREFNKQSPKPKPK
jgi:hypothetical protein